MAAPHQAPLYFTTSQRLFKLMSVESVMLSNLLILCRPPLLLPSIFPNTRIFSKESALHIRWPEYWSFSNNLFNGYPGLISSRIDWFDLLAVQGTLKSLFQHHNSKPLIFLHSSFFIIQLSHLYTTIKRPQLWLHRLWQKTYASSYMTLSWFVITFLPEESIF